MDGGDRLATGISSGPSAEAAQLQLEVEGGSHKAGLVPGRSTGKGVVTENHRTVSRSKAQGQFVLTPSHYRNSLVTCFS